MNIGKRTVGPGHPCFVVAEISCNHTGSFDHARLLVKAAKDAGADAVKFQAFTIPEILKLRGEGPAPSPWQHLAKADLYCKAVTPLEWLPELFDLADKLGLVAFASVFGYDSLAALERLNCPAYKIARTDNQEGWLIDAVRSTRKPVFISREIIDATTLVQVEHPPESLDGTIPIYCPVGYPASPDQLSLKYLGPYGWARDLGYFGLSSHCLDPMVPVLAIGLGAHYLEYHLMLEEGKYGDQMPLDTLFSLNPRSFTEMVMRVRKAERLLA